MTDTLGNLHPALWRAWHPLCRSSELDDVPRRFRLLGESWVAFRSPGGEARVFRDVCPHRRAPLSLGSCEGDAVRCAYHGWVFDGEGSLVEIPALGEGASLPTRGALSRPHSVMESHSMLFIAPKEPLTPTPRLAIGEGPEFLRGDVPMMQARASAGLLADNFLDVAHFPFVHAGTFGASEAREVPHYSVERDGYSFSALYEHEFANREDPEVAAGRRALLQRRRLTYRYQAPFHLELDIEFLDAGGTNVIGFFLVPLDEENVRIYSSLWRDDLAGSPEAMAEAVDFEVAVIEEDLAVQAAYEFLDMPLDVSAEVHTRADRTTLEMRRILSDLTRASELSEC